MEFMSGLSTAVFSFGDEILAEYSAITVDNDIGKRCRILYIDLSDYLKRYNVLHNGIKPNHFGQGTPVCHNETYGSCFKAA